MPAMEDPTLTLVGLLQNNWNYPSTVPFVSTDWYNEKKKMPQISVTAVTKNPQYIGMSDDLPNQVRRWMCLYALDIWTLDKDDRYQICEECDRIINKFCNIPGGDLEFIESRGYRYLDEATRPRLFHSRLLVEVRYYK